MSYSCLEIYHKRIKVIVLLSSLMVMLSLAELSLAAASGFVMSKNTAHREVWVNIGKTKGVEKDQVFEVYRGSRLIATLRIAQVFPDFSVAKAVFDKDFESVEEMDEVFSKSLPQSGQTADSNAAARNIGAATDEDIQLSGIQVSEDIRQAEPVTRKNAAGAQVSELQRQIATLSKKITDSDNEIKSLREQLQDKDKALASTQKQLLALQGSMEQRQKLLASQEEKKKQLAVELTAIKQAISELK